MAGELWSWPYGRPGSDPIRPFQKPAFVAEHDGSPFSSRVLFFEPASDDFFQRRIVSPSRPKALPTGRWTPAHLLKIRQTCTAWSLAPNSSSMTLPTRQLVHRLAHTRNSPNQSALWLSYFSKEAADCLSRTSGSRRSLMYRAYTSDPLSVTCIAS